MAKLKCLVEDCPRIIDDPDQMQVRIELIAHVAVKHAIEQTREWTTHTFGVDEVLSPYVFEIVSEVSKSLLVKIVPLHRSFA